MDLVVVLAVLLCLSAVGYLLLGLRLIGGGPGVGKVPIGMTFLVIGLWVFGGALELTATSYVVFSIGRTAHFLGTTIVPVALLICFREYTGRATSRSMMAGLLVMPVATVIVAATNHWHQLMWQLPAVNAAGEFLTRPAAWGPWFLFLHAPYGYVIIGSSILTLVTHSSAVAPAHRRGLQLLAAAAVVPVIAVAAYDFGFGPDTVSLVPIVLMAMMPIYAWLIIGEQIIEFSPLAYETVFQNMQDPVVVLDDRGRIIGINRGAETLLNLTEKEALRASIDSVFGTDAPEVYEALDSGRPQKMMTTTGRFLHVQVSPIKTGKTGANAGRVLMFRDVSDVEKAQREVRSSERLLRTLIDHSVNGVVRLRWVTDENGERALRCIFVNAAAGRFLHASPEDIIDRTADEVVKLASTGMSEQDVEELLRRFRLSAELGEVVDTEVRVEQGGISKWMRVIGEPVDDDVAVTFVDITDKKAKELQMESIAWSDPLTGVLNRRGFERDAAQRLSSSNDFATGSLLFIDLNEFKQINDSCGHEIGDQLLTIAAERLRRSLRSCDIIGRPGGDEFVALVPDVTPDVAEQLAERLTRSLEKPYLIDGQTLHCAASIGLALYPEHANTLTGLLRAADQAMYRAKARCRGVTSIGRRDLLEKAV